MRFTVLASGSGGNASLVQADGFGALLDAGLGPKQLAERLRTVGQSWSAVQAVLLTHTHSDHWKESTLNFLARRKIPLYCHASHHKVLSNYAAIFQDMLSAGLVRPFEAGEEFTLAGLRCRPLPVRHDGGATFGFRIEGPPDLFGRATALGYATDLGTWDDELVASLADVDLLAIEFNHDVGLQRSSGRTAFLIERVLGDEGHLSNEQAAALVRAVLARSTAGRLRHLVQLHLSGECNRPGLARKAARSILAEMACPARVQTACQDTPSTPLILGPTRRRAPAGPRRPPALRGHVRPTPTQGWLPGLNGTAPGDGEPGA